MTLVLLVTTDGSSGETSPVWVCLPFAHDGDQGRALGQGPRRCPCPLSARRPRTWRRPCPIHGGGVVSAASPHSDGAVSPLVTNVPCSPAPHSSGVPRAPESEVLAVASARRQSGAPCPLPHVPGASSSLPVRPGRAAGTAGTALSPGLQSSDKRVILVTSRAGSGRRRRPISPGCKAGAAPGGLEGSSCALKSASSAETRSEAARGVGGCRDTADPGPSRWWTCPGDGVAHSLGTGPRSRSPPPACSALTLPRGSCPCPGLSSKPVFRPHWGASPLGTAHPTPISE